MEYTREVNPSSYPNWSSWKKKEVYNSSDVNSLLTLNGPAQAGADVTGDNTAASISEQGGLATKSSADWDTEVAGTGKPANNADVTDYKPSAHGLKTIL